MTVQIVKKAYRIWNPEDFDYEHPDNGNIVYAETRGKAKSRYPTYDFTKVKCVRMKRLDKIMYNGKEMTKEMALYEEKKEARNAKILALPDDETYYVQDSRDYVGNAVLWWGLNNSGYVCGLDKAQEYTKEAVVKHFLNGRETDIIWPKSHVVNATKVIVDRQGLNREWSV